ncbi:hypothetical protein HOC01_02025 [archaeon]|jgi:tRNA (guanine26-N2/guanine27-N2)-dimethyltransferase|nr:hypothetical protein [archaeon]MBT6697902.1 hypothetical protein [archaeon]
MHIQEEKIVLDIEVPEGDVSKDMDVFYNPEMVHNRNVSVAVLSALMNGGTYCDVEFDSLKSWKIALPLCGSGIRGLRFLTELEVGRIAKFYVNDKRIGFEKDFKELAAVNGVSLDLVPKETKGQKLEGSDLDIKVFEKDAELFLLDNRHFDYIDIDPFGSPNPFLASSIARLTRGGVLAITATDTAAFTGTYKSVTRRKYWSSSMYNYMKHNVGLRILIRKVQLLGAQFDKALIPILSYHKGHYYRVFFVNKNTKTACDQVLKQHKYFLYDKKGIDFKVSYDTVWIDGDRRTEEAKVRPGVQVAGPLWSGELCNLDLLRMISHKDMFELEKEFFEGLEREAEFEERNIGTDRKVGFYDMHILASYLKLKEVPKFDEFLAKVKGVRCSFSRMGFYSKLSSCDILEILKNY